MANKNTRAEEQKKHLTDSKKYSIEKQQKGGNDNQQSQCSGAEGPPGEEKRLDQVSYLFEKYN